MKDSIKKYIGAIKQAEKNLMSNAVDIGKYLYLIEKDGGVLKSIVEGNFSFSYNRARAFKQLYEDVYVLKSIPLAVLTGIGAVDKVIEITQTLKGASGDFLMVNPAPELKSRSKAEVRGMVKDYAEEHGIPSRVGRFGTEKERVNLKAVRYFRTAEDALFDIVGMFDGAISGKYKEEFRGWDGKGRVLKLIQQLNAAVEGLK